MINSEEITGKNKHHGFVITTLDKLINWARSGSLWSIIFGSGCCTIEIEHATGPKYDLERFGVTLTDTHFKADLLIVSGALNHKMAKNLRKIYEQMLSPKWVVAVGSCANGGGPYSLSYSVITGCDRIIPVDIYIPGCPPTPEAIIYGIIQLQHKIKATTNIYV